MTKSDKIKKYSEQNPKLWRAALLNSNVIEVFEVYLKNKKKRAKTQSLAEFLIEDESAVSFADGIYCKTNIN